MESIIEQLIADFHERELPKFTRRQCNLPWLPGKIDTVVGMRRSGKTYFVFQVISDLLAGGLSKESVLYLNLEDERLLPMKAFDLHWIPDIYFRRYPQAREAPSAFFFDEIQNIPGWERFVRRLLDSENVHICLTGSSAKLLSREIATSLRGRAISTEIYPFHFMEALAHQGIDVKHGERPGSKKRALLENRLQAYLAKGGFPEVQDIDEAYRLRILQDYLNVVILRDLVERHRITNTVALRYMIRHIMNAPATLFSVNKFYNDLKSQGIGCGKNTLHEFLDHLCDTYLFFQLFLHTTSERARMVNPRKVYVIDTGLIHACSSNPRRDTGHLLENFVFMELRRRHETIEYYKTAGGREVDFLVTDRRGRKTLVQAAAGLEDPSTRTREFRALEEAMEETGLNEGVVVTLHREEQVETPSGRIQVVPAWLWALSL